MGDLKTYDVEINGVQTQVRLTDDDAKKRGLSESKPAAKTKAATPKNK